MIINGHEVEFVEEHHIYLVDGMVLASVTNILKLKFGDTYKYVRPDVLERARVKGVELHSAIEEYEKHGKESDLKEFRNYKFLKKKHQFECLGNEMPVILFKDNKPIACGTLDMLIKHNGEVGLADIKRTSTLNKEYLAYQLNLYRIAYQQSYKEEINFLKGIHLRENVRRFVDIPINEKMAWELVDEYMEVKNSE